jgi:hypothetical protein
MAEFKLDRFKYNWRGEWSPSTEYKRDDVVGYGGSSFVCIVAHTSDSLFSADLNNQDITNNVPDPRWIKMTDGYDWRDQWQMSDVYDPGDIVFYGGNLYLCVEAHVSTSAFADNSNKWVSYSESISFRQNWETSTLYRINEVIRYNGIVYRCIEEHTSSSSLTDNQSAWTIYYEGFQYRNRWSSGTTYRLNDIVIYKGSLYKAIQENSDGEFSNNNWTLIAPGYRFKGEWNSGNTYGIGDVVRHGGWLFYSLTNNTNSNPVNSIYQPAVKDWEIISKGINFRGNWNVNVSYKTGDIVRRGGQLFLALLDTDVATDGSSLDYLDSSNWELLNKGQNYRADWKVGETYAVGDIVVFFGSAFICKIEHESDNINFPAKDIPSVGSGFIFWDIVVEAGSEVGLQRRGDLLTYNLVREFYGDDSSFGNTRLPIGNNGELLKVDESGDIIYKNYGEINRVFYVAETGVDDENDPQAGISPFKPYKTVRFACERADDSFEGTTTVRVRTGRYKEVLPIIVPAKTAIVGDELRSTSIVAAGPVANLADDSEFTIASLTRILQIIQEVITNQTGPLTRSAGNPLTPVVLTKTIQVSFDPPVFDEETGVEIFDTTTIPVIGINDAAVDIQNLILKIQQYITFRVESIGSLPSITGSNIANQSEGYRDSVLVLQANKHFLAEEAVAFTKLQFPSYNFNEELCKRDLRRFVDAWAYDITFTGNYKSILAARYYANGVKGSQLEDMFYLRDASGVRNLTVSGLNGELIINELAPYNIPTGGAYCSLDPGWGPADERTWIKTRSPYIQNVTTFGRGAVGQKIDGALHAGGNKSMVSNDFTQIIDDGIGAWVLNQGRAELVSVFSYYAHVGYLATNGGIIRGTNGNCSYGTYGALADGNDNSEIPLTAEVNNRTTQASATVFAGDFTDTIQIIEWDNCGINYSQAAASFVGAGIGASVKFEDFRDDAVFNTLILDTSDTITQSIGGGGYLRIQNNAQVHETPNGDLTSITLAANDPNDEEDYIGMRIILTGGPGTGQYGYISAYNSTTKVASVLRESDDVAGWDHVIPGTPVTNPLTLSTSYRIEPRPIFTHPGFNPEQFALGLNTNWGSIVYGETTDFFTNIEGQLGTGDVNDQDGLVPVSATFNIEKRGRQYIVEIENSGAGYSVGDEIIFFGNELGGITPYNDLVITVTAITNDSTNSITAISSNGVGASGKFIAITEAGTAGQYSFDGESWPDGFNMPVLGDWTVLGAGNNQFVAISTNSSDASYSFNGIDWTLSQLPLIRSWNSIVYGSDKFVAVADQNTAAYSTNGESWTAVILPTPGGSGLNNWIDIAYGKNIFVAISSTANIIATSTNGINWTGSLLIDDSTAIAKEWVGIAYGNDRFVALAKDGTVLYSFDTVTWFEETMPVIAGTLEWSKIRYGQGVFFALTKVTAGGSTDVAATSEYGISWTTRTLASSTNWKSIAFGNPFVELLDSSVGRNTPVWVAISNNNITNKIRTGARATGRVIVEAGIIFRVKIWNPGSGYRNEPVLTVVSPTATSEAKFQNRLGDGVLPQPSWLNRGVGYRTGTTRITITGNGSADVIPVGKFLTLDKLSKFVTPGAQIFFQGNPTRYTVVTIQPLNNNTNNTSGRAVIRVSPELRVRDLLEHNSSAVLREKYSQVRITGHDFLDIGTGNFEQTNYPELYSGVFFSAPENEVVEVDGGRVFYTATDQGGNFRTGELFSVEQATGIVTISADFFDLSGLEELRLGGIRVGGSGAVIREFSTDPTLSEDSNNVIPTQRAIKSFLDNRLSLGGSEVATFEVQTGQILLGGPDTIGNPLGLKIIVRSRTDFEGSGAGLSGSIIAQNMFYRSFTE